MKTLFITGVSRGIGRSTALYFKKQGWRVIGTVRDKNIEDSDIELIPMDLSDSVSIRSAVEKVYSITDRVDVVVNCAGYGMKGLLELFTMDEIETLLKVNLVGTIDVIKNFLPYLRKEGSGTLINVTSMSGQCSAPLTAIYNSSKRAVEGFSESIYYELKPIGIKVKVVAPGLVNTTFQKSTSVKRNNQIEEYKPNSDKLLDKLLYNSTGGISPDIVAKKIYKASKSNSNRFRYCVGTDSLGAYYSKKILPFRLFRKIVEFIFN